MATTLLGVFSSQCCASKGRKYAVTCMSSRGHQQQPSHKVPKREGYGTRVKRTDLKTG